MDSHLETARLPEGDTESARKETTTPLKRDAGSGIQHTKGTIGFPSEFGPYDAFCIVLGNVFGPGLYTNVNPVLATAGPYSLMFALLVLGYIATVVSEGHVRMLNVWPIRSSTVAFTQSFTDPWLAFIMGWLHFAIYTCRYTLVAQEVAMLMNTLGLGRTGCLLANASAFVLPVLFTLMDIRWFKRFQLWLVALKLLNAAVIIFFIVPYIWWHTRPVSQEIPAGTTVHECIAGTLYAMFRLCPAYMGMETIALIAPETIVDHDKDRVSRHLRTLSIRPDTNLESDQQPPGIQEDRFTSPTQRARRMVHWLYAFTAYGAGELSRRVDNPRPHCHGHVDPTLSIFVTSSEAVSESLGHWMKVLLITIGITTEVSVLYAASRELYWMSVRYSGQHDGTNNINHGRIKLNFSWSGLSRKTVFHVPWVSVLATILLPLAFLLVQSLHPNAASVVSFLVRSFNAYSRF
jgi:hypothetical protein